MASFSVVTGKVASISLMSSALKTYQLLGNAQLLFDENSAIYGGILKDGTLMTTIDNTYNSKFGVVADDSWLTACLWLSGQLSPVTGSVYNPDLKTAVPIFYKCDENTGSIARTTKLYLTYNGTKSEGYIEFTQDKPLILGGKSVLVDFPRAVSGGYYILITDSNNRVMEAEISISNSLSNLSGYTIKGTLYNTNSSLTSAPIKVTATSKSYLIAGTSVNYVTCTQQSYTGSYYVYYCATMPS